MSGYFLAGDLSSGGFEKEGVWKGVERLADRKKWAPDNNFLGSPLCSEDLRYASRGWGFS
jgi:hypothetical protein